MCDHGASLTVKNSEGMTPIMFAAEMGFDKVVNYLSLRTRDLNEEDAYCNTILIHHLRNRKEKNDDFKMASNLIVRGADINYVNSNGYTALHIMVENKNIEAVKFLLSKNAERHLMDLNGEDACDKAKKNGLGDMFPIFFDCNIHKKIIPRLPDGSYPNY